MANSQELQDIISASSKQSLVDAQKNADNLNKTLQETIVLRNKLNDTVVGAKNMEAVNKAAIQDQAAQERLLKTIAQRQAAEEKLTAIRVANQAKLDAAETKSLAADNAKIARIKRIEEAEIKRQAAEVETSQSITAAQANEATSLGRVEQASLKTTKARKLSNLELEREKVNNQANVLALKNQAKELNSAKGSLDQRSAALLRLKKSYSSLTEAERNAPFGQRLLGITQRLDTQVKGLDKSLGNSQRNVGNYGNAFSKAFGVIRTAANILPGIGIAGIFGLALDPLLELISKLDIFKEKINQVIQLRKNLNEAQLEGTKTAQTELTLLRLNFKSISDANIPLEKRRAIYGQLQRDYPDYFKNISFEDALAGKAAKTYDTLAGSILASARARAFADRITANTNKQLDAQAELNTIETEINNLRIKRNSEEKRTADQLSTSTREGAGISGLARTSNLNGQINDKLAKRQELAKGINNLQKENLKLDELARKQIAAGGTLTDIKIPEAKIKDDSKKREKDARDSAAALVQIQIDAEQEVAAVYKKQSDNLNFSLETRLDAQKNYTDTVLRIADLEAQKDIVGKENTANELLAIESKREKKRLEINVQTADDIVKITKESLAEIDRVRALQFQRDLTNLDRIRDEELTKLNERYAAGKLSLEDYEKEKLELTRKANRIAIQEQIDQVQKLIDIDSARQLDVTDNLAKLAALRLRYSETEIDLTKKTSDEKKAVYDKEKELLQEVFNFGRQLTASLFQSRIDDIDKEKEAAEERKNIEIENVNESVASEQDKKDRIAVIEANAANEQEQLTAKQNEIKRKQAIADKAAAIAQAIINIALAQTKNVATLGFLGLPLNAVIAAIGAVQIASIIAQPIPKFAKGKSASNNYEGLAYVGDGGMNELVINKDGSSWVTPNTPTLTHIGRDTQVISGPEFERMQMMAKPEYSGAMGGKSWDVSPLVASNERTAKRIERAVSKMKVSATHITKGGFVKESTTISAFNKRMNRKFGW